MYTIGVDLGKRHRQVGCETCINPYGRVEVLEEIGITGTVGHAWHLRRIAEARIKTDKIDARVMGSSCGWGSSR